MVECYSNQKSNKVVLYHILGTMLRLLDLCSPDSIMQPLTLCPWLPASKMISSMNVYLSKGVVLITFRRGVLAN